MEHVRCAQCRNPIRGRQAAVRHARAGMAFHLDCWAELHQHVQQDYSVQVQSDGLSGLLGPYSRTSMAAWLPSTAIDVAAEELADMVVDDLADRAVDDRGDDQPDERSEPSEGSAEDPEVFA